ncbi:MAG: restriction endonuclease [Nitrospirae bacterium]|uniref:restriction endonuclease n=1 Tax=Candidatus Magnetobacterium casense TaxID=1455061 RepID=UPI0005900174|nr:restriction endonuclease [Candidatus Magnetobacterium casensis]MBF0339074.1 restriction endonuclease [Nitrospirota bacterium]
MPKLKQLPDPQPHTIASWILCEADNTEFKLIDDVTIKIIASHLTNKTQTELEDIEEQHRDKVIQSLKDIHAENLIDGIQPIFEIIEEGNSTYIKVFPQNEVKLLLKQLTDITPEQFERFCVHLLETIGAKPVKHNGGKDDGGVDFVGHNIPVGANLINAPTNSKVIVIGQAKTNKVTETEIRKFVGGAIREIHEKKSNIGALTPVIYAFWTTSDFHTSAIRYARALGIWYLNGLGLAQLSYNVGIKRIPTL